MTSADLLCLVKMASAHLAVVKAIGPVPPEQEVRLLTSIALCQAAADKMHDKESTPEADHA